jgi:multiple sugar transport system ATP-binding protein
LVYVTHDQVEAMTLADRIVVLEAGVVRQHGQPMALHHLPQNQFVAGFIGSPKMNFLPATAVAVAVDGGGVMVQLTDGTTGLVPVEASGVRPGEALTLGIRPEHVGVAFGDTTAATAATSNTATLTLRGGIGLVGRTDDGVALRGRGLPPVPGGWSGVSADAGARDRTGRVAHSGLNQVACAAASQCWACRRRASAKQPSPAGQAKPLSTGPMASLSQCASRHAPRAVPSSASVEASTGRGASSVAIAVR